MTRQLQWCRGLCTIIADKLMEQDYRTDEGYVTQLLELGQQSSIEEYQRALDHTVFYG